MRGLPRTREGVDLAIEAGVVAVFVAEEVGRKKGVVNAGVEDRSLVGGAAFDGDAVEKVAPGFASLGVNVIEVAAGNLFLEIGLGASLAHKGDADFEHNFMRIAEVEPCACALALGRFARGVDWSRPARERSFWNGWLKRPAT